MNLQSNDKLSHSSTISKINNVHNNIINSSNINPNLKLVKTEFVESKYNNYLNKWLGALESLEIEPTTFK